MKRSDAKNEIDNMEYELEWDRLAEIYTAIIGPPRGATAYQMYSELCFELGVFE